MWYAVTQDEHGKTTIAMAIQPGENPEGGLSPAEPTDVGLIYPDDVFTFDQSSINLRIEHKLKKKKLKEKKPTRNNTNLRRQAFSDQNHSSTYSRNFNKHNGAFFQNNPETKKPDDTEGLLKRLLTQDGAVGVRYYFALKKDTKYDNMIRIILVAVDAKGNDLIQINDPATNKLVEGLVVQKSIPPGSQKLDYCER